MSDLIGTSTPFTAISESVDRRADQRFGLTPLDLLWSRSGVVGSGGGASVLALSRFDMPRVIASGRRGDKLISLTAVDSLGAAIAGATVKAYRTSDDVPNSLVADTQEGPAVTSAADGQFTLAVPNADAHYVVAYKAGSPDVAGTTINTIVGV